MLAIDAGQALIQRAPPMAAAGDAHPYLKRAVQGSLEGNAPVLKEHCAPEMVERFSGIAKTLQAQVRGFSCRLGTGICCRLLMQPLLRATLTGVRPLPCRVCSLHLPWALEAACKLHMLRRPCPSSDTKVLRAGPV